MRKLLTVLLLALFVVCGYAQSIDPALEKEMGLTKDDDKINVFVIMRQQYDRDQLNRRANYYTSRAARREFVVNELKQFADASQHDIRQSLAKMEKNEMVTTPKVLWMANALYFSATKQAIYDLAKRGDIEVIGLDEESDAFEIEESRPATNSREMASHILQVRANQAWNLGYTGQGVVVAVLDSGVNYNHVDFADHLWDGGEDFPNHGWNIGDDNNDPFDLNGHGTHCAGIAVGDGSGGQQTGIAPNALLMCLKITRKAAGGSSAALTCDGMQWAVEHGCDVFTLSHGWRNPSTADRNLFRLTCAAVLEAGVIGAICVGNDGNSLNTVPVPNNVRAPGCCPPPYLDPIQQANPGGLSCCVCIGAVDGEDEATYFSSHGPVTWLNTSFADYPYSAGSSAEFGLIRPDVCAPGMDIVSADYTDPLGYTIKSGTSMSTPCAAGCMALMLSKNPNLTPADICRLLEETAVPLEQGKSNITGYGRVDALSAVNAVSSPLLSLESYVVHDEQGNNDQTPNPGETVLLDLDLLCGPDDLNGATLNINSSSEHITITNGTLALPNLAAGQVQTIDGFSFSLNDNAPVKERIDFVAQILVDDMPISYFRFSLFVHGKIMNYLGASIVNDDNGVLEPGETANLRVLVGNSGNVCAQTIVGTLSTTSQYLAIHGPATFGDIPANGQVYADFSVTLSNNAPNPFPLPLSLEITNDANETNQFAFNLCSITTTANMEGAGTLVGAGTYGSGTLVTLSANSNSNHTFLYWEKDGALVDYIDHSFAVNGNANFRACFEAVSHDIPIGQAQAKRQFLPSFPYYRYSLVQQIYTAEEIGRNGEVTSVAFFNAGETKTRHYVVYMKLTDKTTFQDETDWVNVTMADKFYEGNVTVANGEWITLTFDRPFVYDGISNMVLTIHDNTGEFIDAQMECRVYHSNNDQTHFIYADEADFNPANPNCKGFCLKQKNQILLGMATDDVEEKEVTTECYCYVKDKVLYTSTMLDDSKIEVFDILGRSVMTVRLTGNSCSVANLTPGSYLVKLTDGAVTKVQKLVIPQ